MRLVSVTYFDGFAKALYSDGSKKIVSTADADLMIDLAEVGYIV